MSLEQLDAFLERARREPDLERRLRDRSDPLALEDFLDLAQRQGFQISEDDVLAAQVRAEAELSDDELQRRAGEEARRLRHFISG